MTTIKNLKRLLILAYSIDRLYITFLFAVFVTSSNVSCSHGYDLKINHIPKIAFITPSNPANLSKEEINDLKSLENSLMVAGLWIVDLPVKDVNSADLSNFNIIALPYASAKGLSGLEINKISQAVKEGSNLIFDGDTKLRETLNIQLLNDSLTITKIDDLKHSSRKLYWTTSCKTRLIDNSANKHSVLCIDDTSKLPLAVSGSYGKGKFIYLATLFDPNTDKGYSRFPFLIETIQDVFGYAPIAERQAVEMYFDQGNRTDTMSVYDLAKLWRKNKIKRIYASGWYYDSGYDYGALIKACHENGILVLCWLETPMISIKFWEKHPEWREKTVFQRDAQIDWRYLMNLADENCRKEVFKETEDFLMKYDWDGVDFAELYFEPSPVGPELPENFTPMNSIVRKEFEQIGGFDPVLLFDTRNPHYWKTNKADWIKFATYRKDLLFRLKKSFLDFFSSVKNKKTDFEIMLTVLDVSITPELSDFIGEDTQHSLALYKQYDITLQVEDPSNCWGLTPERYDKMGKFYRKEVRGKGRLLFDCNVVSAHELGNGGFPSEIPSGEEIRQIAYNMNLHDVRPAFYSEDAVSGKDYKNISTVLANKTKVYPVSENVWKINTPNTVFINTGNPAAGIKLDNREWYAGEIEQIIVPSGEHTISFSTLNRDANIIRMKNISGNLESAIFKDSNLEFKYTEEISSCYVIINKQPLNIYIDGKKTECKIFKNENDEFVLKLPEGTHRVKLDSRK